MNIAVAPRGLEKVLADEIKFLSASKAQSLVPHTRLYQCENFRPYFAQNIWLDVQEFEFESISQAAKHLRAIQRNWSLHSVAHHRRAKLIQEQLPKISSKPVEPFTKLPSVPMGSWTLIEPQKIIYSGKCSSIFADGEIHFNENKADPPSRAYLKLWEIFTLAQKKPDKDELVIDLGSSPGGWTWALDQLGARVISVDKAPLSAKVSKRVEYIEQSAFSLQPQRVVWFFSDIICYPQRLKELVQKWEPYCENFVCTVKFQGQTDFAIIEQLLTIKDSKVTHLSANRHELTWYKIL